MKWEFFFPFRFELLQIIIFKCTRHIVTYVMARGAGEGVALQECHCTDLGLGLSIYHSCWQVRNNKFVRKHFLLHLVMVNICNGIHHNSWKDEWCAVLKNIQHNISVGRLPCLSWSVCILKTVAINKPHDTSGIWNPWWEVEGLVSCRLRWNPAPGVAISRLIRSGSYRVGQRSTKRQQVRCHSVWEFRNKPCNIWLYCQCRWRGLIAKFPHQ